MTEKLQEQGISIRLPETCNACDFYSDLFRGILKVAQITSGRFIYSFTIVPYITNKLNGLHGGAVAGVTERVAIACARTIVPEDKPLFPGEQSISYLSAATINTELVADGSAVRNGRDTTVVSVEFRLKNHGKLVYTAQVTFVSVPKVFEFFISLIASCKVEKFINLDDSPHK